MKKGIVLIILVILLAALTGVPNASTYNTVDNNCTGFLPRKYRP